MPQKHTYGRNNATQNKSSDI